MTESGAPVDGRRAGAVREGGRELVHSHHALLSRQDQVGGGVA